MNKTELDDKLRLYNQQQLTVYYDELDEVERHNLSQQIEQLDIERVTSAFAKYSQPHENGIGKVEPIPSARYGSVADAGHVQLDAYWQVG